MKISLWPKRFGAFIKNIGVYWVPITIVLAIVGLFATIFSITGIQSKRLQEKFPIGKHVVIKGTGLQGTIARGVSGCGCDVKVLVIENGKLETVSVDAKLLE